jgi:type I restriction enzyme S subunit
MKITEKPFSIPDHWQWVELQEEELPDLPPDWRWVSGDQMLYYVTSGSRGWSKYYDQEGQLFIRVGDISDPDVEIDFSDV